MGGFFEEGDTDDANHGAEYCFLGKVNLRSERRDRDRLGGNRMQVARIEYR